MKKITLKIAGKIGIGYGILLVAFLLNAALVIRAVVISNDMNNRISKVFEPSVYKLYELEKLVSKSHLLLHSWVFVDKIDQTPDKLRLVELQSEKYPQLIADIKVISDQWDEASRNQLKNLSQLISDSLFVMQKGVMGKLRSMSDYDDPEVLFSIVPMVSDQGEITELTNHVLKQINNMVSSVSSQMMVARSEMEMSFVNLKRYIIISSLVLLAIAIITGLITVRSLVKPINKIKKRLQWMSKGSLPESDMKVRSDEIGEMTQVLNQLVGGLKAISNFALEIGRGNYQSEFTPLSDDDVLGNSLLRMRDDLHAASVEESKRKLEDQQRNWTSAGIAKFSEILRQDNDKLDVLSFQVIRNLVNYMDANQGGIFMLNDTDASQTYIELVSCYAYNRQKYQQKRIELGEGLVGRCLQEKETIYLSEVPNEYIKIKSGMGEANPRNLILVPLIMNNDVFGVIELASFNEIQKYQIEFVEKIAESIASTLKAVRINMRTTKLLEQSRIQTEELASQEEEMRQNMEELRATQEQSFRREKELEQVVEELQKKMSDSH